MAHHVIAIYFHKHEVFQSAIRRSTKCTSLEEIKHRTLQLPSSMHQTLTNTLTGRNRLGKGIYSKFLYKSFLVQKSDKVISTQNFHNSFSYENISIKFSYVSASY